MCVKYATHYHSHRHRLTIEMYWNDKSKSKCVEWYNEALWCEIKQMPSNGAILANSDQNVNQKRLAETWCNSINNSDEIRWDSESSHLSVQIPDLMRLHHRQQTVAKTVCEMYAVV